MEKKCKLCLQRAEPRRPWDEAWDERCVESICKLLRLDHSEYGDFFRCLVYCSPCHQLIREVDYTVRTLTALKQKCLNLRTTLSQMLIPNFELLGHDDCDKESCSAVRRKLASEPGAAESNTLDQSQDCPILPLISGTDDNLVTDSDTNSDSDSDIIELEFPRKGNLTIQNVNKDAATVTKSTDIPDDVIFDAEVPADELKTSELINPFSPQILTVLDLKEEEISELSDNESLIESQAEAEDAPEDEYCPGDGDETEPAVDSVTIENEQSDSVNPPMTETSGPRRSQRIRNKPNYRLDPEEENAEDSDFAPDPSESASVSEDDEDPQISTVDPDEAATISLFRSVKDKLANENPILFKMLFAGRKPNIRKRIQQSSSKRKRFIRSSRNRLNARARLQPKSNTKTKRRNRLNKITRSRGVYWTKLVQGLYTGKPDEPVLNPKIDCYVCEIDGCTFRMCSEDWLDVHKVEHQISTKLSIDELNSHFQCPVCKLQFLKLEVYESHLERVHRPTIGEPTHIQCPLCSKKFGKTQVRRKEISNFLGHFKSIHVPRDPTTDNRRFKYLCPVRDCRSRCRTRRYLEIHHRKCHEGDPRPFKCEECSKGFHNGTLLAIHKAKHHAAVPVGVCHICGNGYSHRGRLIAHIKDKHPEAETFVCKICSWAMYFQDDCEAHEKLHKPNSFSCIVNKCYLSRSKDNDHGSAEGLTRHVLEAHSSIFKCTQCSYTAKKKVMVKTHMLRHTKDKPFLCKGCPKTFASKTLLDAHEENKHPDPNSMKEYKCKLCPETFHSRQALAGHTYRHKHGLDMPKFSRKSRQDGQGSSQSVSRKRKKQATGEEAAASSAVESKSISSGSRAHNTKDDLILANGRPVKRKRKPMIPESESDEADFDFDQYLNGPDEEFQAEAEDGSKLTSITTETPLPSFSYSEQPKATPPATSERYLTLRDRDSRKTKVFYDL